MAKAKGRLCWKPLPVEEGDLCDVDGCYFEAVDRARRDGTMKKLCYKCLMGHEEPYEMVLVRSNWQHPIYLG